MRKAVEMAYAVFEAAGKGASPDEVRELKRKAAEEAVFEEIPKLAFAGLYVRPQDSAGMNGMMTKALVNDEMAAKAVKALFRSKRPAEEYENLLVEARGMAEAEYRKYFDCFNFVAADGNVWNSLRQWRHDPASGAWDTSFDERGNATSFTFFMKYEGGAKTA